MRDTETSHHIDGSEDDGQSSEDLAEDEFAVMPELEDNPAAAIAPITVTPERAFIPDISGVCSKLGTLLISL